jgi:hypothetical protein
MTNVSAWIKTLVAATLVATILSSLGSKNDSTTGLKGSRRLQDLSAFIIPFNPPTPSASSGPRFTNFINFSVFPRPPVAPSPTNTTTPVTPTSNSTSTNATTPIPPRGFTNEGASAQVGATLQGLSQTSGGGLLPDFNTVQSSFFGTVAPSPPIPTTPATPVPANSTSTNTTTPIPPRGFTNEGSSQVGNTLQALSQNSGGGLLPDFNTVQSSFFGTPGGFSNGFFP